MNGPTSIAVAAGSIVAIAVILFAAVITNMGAISAAVSNFVN